MKIKINTESNKVNTSNHTYIYIVMKNKRIKTSINLNFIQYMLLFLSKNILKFHEPH